MLLVLGWSVQCFSVWNGEMGQHCELGHLAVICARFSRAADASAGMPACTWGCPYISAVNKRRSKIKILFCVHLENFTAPAVR